MMPTPAHTAPFNRVPPGLTLLRTHEGHTDVIKCLAWAPDGQLLASASADRRIHLWYAADAAPFQTLAEHADYVFSVDWAANGRAIAAAVNGPAIPLWDLERNRVDQSLAGHDGAVFAVAWSPNGRFLASGSCDDTVALWYPPNQSPLRRLRGHTGWVMSVAWSPNGRMLASASRDRSIVIWRTQTGQPEHRLKGHSHIVNSICWSPDGKQLASASDDHTVCLWDTETGRQLHVLEGHTGIVLCVRFSQDGRLLASKSGDGTVRLWRCDTWQPVAVLPEPVRSDFCAGLAFHPTEQQLASLTADERGVRVWQLDYTALFRSAFADTRHYRNAKIVVVGDPGVGKSGLSQVLAGRPWRAASAPGGHQVLNLDAHTLALPDGVIEHRETLLWDLAGAPDYRLATRLHLNEAVAALVVVRPAEGDEAGVLDSIRHWDEVLTQTERTAAAGGLPLHKYLVTVRQNGSGAALSQTRVDAVMRELGFAAFFEVNPRDDRQTGALRQAILDDVDWEALPRVTSNRLFQTIQQFLLARQQTGQLLATVEALYHAFCADHAYLTPGPELQAMFDTGVSRVENRGLIRRLSFGGYLLLRPDRLDAYAAAIIRAAQQAADGLHMLPEEAVLNGRFDVPAAERVADPAQARLLIIATVEELLRHEIALKEVNESGTYLLFPAQAPRERPDRPIGLGYSVVLSFAGPVLSIYTTLAVRLARSRFFRQSAIWKNAATYTAVDGGGCGLSLR
ncbi:MAG: hypothetical protein KC425_09070, partial [Anaerolineales bacterium]|nr:hypothetical protein [Anaerolineales bacterium]